MTQTASGLHDLSYLAGSWHRTALIVEGRHEETGMDVMWLQTSNGCFADLRVAPSGQETSCEAFAGHTRYQPATSPEQGEMPCHFSKLQQPQPHAWICVHEGLCAVCLQLTAVPAPASALGLHHGGLMLLLQAARACWAL